MSDAITAAGSDHVGDITVYYASEMLPDGYRFVEGDTTTVGLIPFALVKSGSPATYYDNATNVVQAAAIASYGSGYDYIEVRVGGSVEMPLLVNITVKNTGGATIVPIVLTEEYRYDIDETVEYTTYILGNNATTYTWTGGAADSRWESLLNWSYGESQPATRQPQAGDTVVFSSTAEGVTIGANTSVAAVYVDAPVSIGKAQNVNLTLTATGTGIVLRDSSATVTVNGVTLSPKPTTTVSHSRVVYDDGTTTYSVALIPGTIVSVY